MGEEGGNEGHEGDEEEGSHEGHEGYEEEGRDEGHEGYEEEGSHEGHEGDEEEGGHEGHEGDEEEGSHEGHGGDEEEAREQDRKGQLQQGAGAPRQQGEDHWGPECKRSDQEQAWQSREQEAERPWQQESMDEGRRAGAQGFEDHGVCRSEEGHTSLRKGEGILRPVSRQAGAIQGTSSRCGDFHTCGALEPYAFG